MKLSVIIPVYNCEDYLVQCLDSLVHQTLSDLEVLAVDDGSNDNSLEILKKYEKSYPHIIRVFHKENGGQASARNLALPHAKGEYIGFVDSDDWVDLSLYEKMCKIADEQSCDIVVCDMVDHFPNRTVHHKVSYFEDKFKQTPSACNKIFRLSLIQGLCFPTGFWYEDFCFTTKALLKCTNIGRFHDAFYHCHCREISTMFNNNSPKNLDMLFVLDELVNYAKQEGLYQQHIHDFEYLIIEHVLITTMNRVALQKHPQKKEVLKKLRHYVNDRIPNLKKAKAFQNLVRNRKIIASLNAHGLTSISKLILKISSFRK